MWSARSMKPANHSFTLVKWIPITVRRWKSFQRLLRVQDSCSRMKLKSSRSLSISSRRSCTRCVPCCVSCTHANKWSIFIGSSVVFFFETPDFPSGVLLLGSSCSSEGGERVLRMLWATIRIQFGVLKVYFRFADVWLYGVALMSPSTACCIRSVSSAIPPSWYSLTSPKRKSPHFC